MKDGAAINGGDKSGIKSRDSVDGVEECGRKRAGQCCDCEKKQHVRFLGYR